MSDLFGGAAGYYSRHRSPHGAAAIGCLAAAFGAGSTVLDLGCGPGTVAIPLAEPVAAVLAVDPDEDMLAEGRRLAEEARLGPRLPAFVAALREALARACPPDGWEERIRTEVLLARRP